MMWWQLHALFGLPLNAIWDSRTLARLSGWQATPVKCGVRTSFQKDQKGKIPKNNNLSGTDDSSMHVQKAADELK